VSVCAAAAGTVTALANNTVMRRMITGIERILFTCMVAPQNVLGSPEWEPKERSQGLGTIVGLAKPERRRRELKSFEYLNIPEIGKPRRIEIRCLIREMRRTASSFFVDLWTPQSID